MSYTSLLSIYVITIAMLTPLAHATLSETLCFAAEMAEGTITDLYAPKKKH